MKEFGIYLMLTKNMFHELADKWNSRKDKQSWHALQIREKMMSQAKMEINKNISIIQTCIVLAPLLGLLGTVTGMIEVFQVMAFNGGGDARAMAGGVSKATLPTMAGMVAALSGSFAAIYLTSTSKRHESELNEIIKRDIIEEYYEKKCNYKCCSRRKR